MIDTTEKTCGRPGCDKKLRRNNTTGMCGSGCRSSEAPKSHRVASSPSTKPVRAAGALQKLRTVAEALGKDPDAILEEFASEWLAHLAATLEG